METLEQMIIRIQRTLGESKSSSPEDKDKHYDCEICKDEEWIFSLETNSARPCKCREVRLYKKIIESCGITESFLQKGFDNYKVTNKQTEVACKTAKDYASTFNLIKETKNNSIALVGQVGCVDADTEYFNGEEWNKISEYKEGDKVLQYNPDTNEGTLTIPKRYIKSKAETLWRIETKRGSINQKLSLDHNFAYITSKGNMTRKPFYEVIETHYRTRQGFYGKVKTSFEYNGPGICLTDDEIRLMVAVIADGYFDPKLNICRINIKKERKIKRLEELLLKTNIQYKKHFKQNGFMSFSFLAPRREKEFTNYWYSCNQHQLTIITDEVIFWDGYCDAKRRRKFFTTCKESADFIQFAFSATGRRATITIDDRVGGIHKSICYGVIISDIEKISLASRVGQEKPQIIKEPTIDGYQYCFEVETGYLVLRRGDRIFITGNSGKTHLTIAIANELMKNNIGVRYMQYREDIPRIKRVATDEEEYTKEINKYKNATVLLIDDLYKSAIGKGQFGEYLNDADKRIIFEIINYRYFKGSPIIISSECSMKQIIELDEGIGTRILEMCKGHIVEIKGKENNYRLRA